MPQRRLLIDLENVPTSDYTLLPTDFLITVFVGKTQTSGLVAVIKMAKIWGERLEVCEVSGTGKNALDFHLAFHLGKLSCENPHDHFVILSKDTGFDPLIKHLHTLNIQCRRIGAINDLLPKPLKIKTPEQKKPASVPNPVHSALSSGSPYLRVCLHLRRMVSKPNTRKSLPSNRGTLKSHLIATFKSEIPSLMYDSIVALLFQEGKVMEENGKLIYCFADEEKL